MLDSIISWYIIYYITLAIDIYYIVTYDDNDKNNHNEHDNYNTSTTN